MNELMNHIWFGSEWNNDIVETVFDFYINKEIIDDWVYVEEFADEALNFFGLKKNDFTSGYYYSISELVSIYLTKTDYLLHFSSDSIPMRNIKTLWIDECILTLDSNPQVKVCNLVWDRKYKEAKKSIKPSNFVHANLLF